MERFGKYAMLAGFVVLLLLLLYYYRRVFSSGENDRTRFAARAGVFGALCAVLYIVPVFQIKVPFLPAFMEIHFDEIPAFIAGFAYGPWTALSAIFIKTILKIPFSSTLTVGEWADFLFGIVFVLPASLLYRKKRNLRGVISGFLISIVLELLVSALFNVYVFLPFYMNVMGLPYERILALCQVANSNVTNLGWPYVLYCVLPLNAIKDVSVIVVTFFVYRHIHNLLPDRTSKK